MVVGCTDGSLRVLDHKFRHVYNKKISKKEISHIKFSPDGSTLAVGAHDGHIYIFSWD